MPHAPAIMDIQKSTVFVDVGFENFILRFYFTSKLRRARFNSTFLSRYDDVKKALARFRGIEFPVDLITALDNYARVEFDRGRKIMIVDEDGAETEYADMLVIKIACK